MSRSRAPKCGRGRGCGVCGDHGEHRRRREADRARYDRAVGEQYQAARDLGAAWVLRTDPLVRGSRRLRREKREHRVTVANLNAELRAWIAAMQADAEKLATIFASPVVPSRWVRGRWIPDDEATP